MDEWIYKKEYALELLYSRESECRTYWGENNGNQIMVVLAYVKKIVRGISEKSWSNNF